MLVQTTYQHVVLDEQGVPYVEGTNTKVIEIVLDKLAYGWSAEEIHRQHPPLSLGQIHSALAYYWDHEYEMDADIQRRLRNMEELRTRSQPTSLVTKLKAEGLLE